jgi:hypothetical protein
MKNSSDLFGSMKQGVLHVLPLHHLLFRQLHLLRDVVSK